MLKRKYIKKPSKVKTSTSKRFDPNTIKKVLELRSLRFPGTDRTKHTQLEISKIVGISPALVYSILDDANFPRALGGRPKPGSKRSEYPTDKRNQSMLKLAIAKPNLPYSDIGKPFGLNKQRVQQILKKLGYTRK